MHGADDEARRAGASPRAHRGWGRAGLVSAGVGLAWLLAELALRVVGYDPVPVRSDASVAVYRELPDERDWGMVPHFEGEFAGIPTAINSDGYRGPEADTSGADAVVVVLGDSITFGVGVRYQDLYSTRLAEQLGPATAVVALGVPGYDVSQYPAVLRIDGLHHHPSQIVLQLCYNDIYVAAPAANELGPIRAFRGSFVSRSRVAQAFVRLYFAKRIENHDAWINDPEVFASRYEGRIASLEGDAELARLMDRVRETYPPEHRQAHDYSRAAMVGRYRWSLEQLAAIAREHHVPVLAFMVPVLEGEADIPYSYGPVHDVIAHEVRRVGFEFLDLADPFVAGSIPDLRVDEIHPNARGHAIIAAELAARLAR